MNKGHCFQTGHAISVYAASRELWDTPIFESPSFVALPSVGALVEGWLLVVPKANALSFAQLPESLFSELEAFLQEVVSVLEPLYGPVSIFEHGPSAARSTIGCGVDYAHLHLVPTRCDLLLGAKQVADNIQWQQIESFKTIRCQAVPADGYWFAQQTYGTSPCYFGTCTNGKPISQLFRRVIANGLDCPSAYDWKSVPGEAIIAATVASLSGHPILA
jgi:ATP adenylyltransferase